ncbi:unnamed protein product [Hymenolepis diminuta]|uniref:Uncharacterized protein n=1 Tax=Hymenolepis diminuta TaxID=6216 RepID=A0A564YHZ7_HYMDI|nr:unnamed protein product [Hymenolepis diminuta]VUZ46817.1 unnamed protein product [Hymenolepis diminuta]
MTIYREMKRLGWESLKGWEMLPPPHTICHLCVSPRSRDLQAPFLHRIITDSDKKWWILYNNVKRKRLWLSQDSGSKPIPQPRSGLHPKEFFYVYGGI